LKPAPSRDNALFKYTLVLTTAYPPAESDSAAVAVAGSHPRGAAQAVTKPTRRRPATIKPAASAAAPPSSDALRASQQHYLSGVIYFQKGDYEKARDEWKLALKLNPGNEDASLGLERIDKLYPDR
jgi:tetratricopeptide (TPR) repeat protein